MPGGSSRCSRGAQITALSDVNLDGAKSVKADVAPGAVLFGSGEQLVASADVDAVLVTSCRGQASARSRWRPPPKV